MSRVFLDTSAAFALLVASDNNHSHAVAAFRALQGRSATLVTTAYVLVETYALLGRRVGLEAVKAFHDDFEPLFETVWVDRELHDRGLALLIERGREDLSLVDAVSFLAIRRRGVEAVFAYDRHFEQEGFELLE